MVLSLYILQIACGNRKEYSVTTFLTEYDVNGKLIAKNQKESYEEFNADSNLIYKEEYQATFGRPDTTQRVSRISYEYKDDLLIKEIVQFQTQTNKGKTIYTYRYSDNRLVEKLQNKQPYKSYIYDSAGNNTHEMYLKDCDACYDHYTYNILGLVTSQRTYLEGSLIGRDTSIYDRNNKLVRRIEYNNHGDTASYEEYVRDASGRLVERKTRLQGTRADQMDKAFAPDYFWYIDKYFYDDKGRQVRYVRYDHGILTHDYRVVYE